MVTLVVASATSMGSLAQSNLRDEIISQVVDPCYLDVVKRNRVEGITDQQMLALLKVMQADDVDKMVASLMPVVRKLDSPEQRTAIYTMGKMVCINSARQGQ